MAGSARRFFTIQEANDLLGHLNEAFGRILQLRRQLRAAHAELERMGAAPTEENLEDLSGPPELARARATFRALYETLLGDMRSLEELGVEVKDLDSGLCDFPALRDGREVLLCWRLGEREVGHWHELTAGFAGRQPLTDEDRARDRTLH